jgi:hypothetical protein
MKKIVDIKHPREVHGMYAFFMGGSLSELWYTEDNHKVHSYSEGDDYYCDLSDRNDPNKCWTWYIYSERKGIMSWVDDVEHYLGEYLFTSDEIVLLQL